MYPGKVLKMSLKYAQSLVHLICIAPGCLEVSYTPAMLKEIVEVTVHVTGCHGIDNIFLNV